MCVFVCMSVVCVCVCVVNSPFSGWLLKNPVTSLASRQAVRRFHAHRFALVGSNTLSLSVCMYVASVRVCVYLRVHTYVHGACIISVCLNLTLRVFLTLFLYSLLRVPVNSQCVYVCTRVCVWGGILSSPDKPT